MMLIPSKLCLIRCRGPQSIKYFPKRKQSHSKRLILFAIEIILKQWIIAILVNPATKTLKTDEDDSMNYLSIRQTAEKWNLSKRRVQILCAEDRINGAIRIDSTWAIPADAQKPADARIKSGKYRKKK